MSTTKFYKFVGTGPEAKALVDKVSARKELVTYNRLVLCNEHGARGLLMDNWDSSKPIALYYLEKQNRQYLKNGEQYGDKWVYYPKLSTKLGKALSKALESEDLRFSSSDMILKDLSLHVMTSTDRSLVFSTAGYIDDKILVSIPVNSSMECDLEVLERVPEWLHEVTQSEWDRIINEYEAQGN